MVANSSSHHLEAVHSTASRSCGKRISEPRDPERARCREGPSAELELLGNPKKRAPGPSNYP